MYGGVLALHPIASGVNVEQLFSPELKSCLESQVTLVYSGQTRLSGINNWEVYKKFFDKVPSTREGLKTIADLSFRAYESIMAQDWDELIKLIGLEGAARRELFPGILSSAMASVHTSIINELPHVGIKVCGAGGGGCFLFTHKEGEREFIEKKVVEAGMTTLPFEVEHPLFRGEVVS
jgi:D-glycero-alpha-D-manno-heptose-7-phosphate kinase